MTYPHFYIWMIRARLGEKTEAAKELSEFVKSRPATEINDMSALIGQFLVGALNEDAFLKATQAVGQNPWDINGRLCQAYYFIGIKHLLADDKSGALKLFKKAIETPYNFSEFYNAKAEINALEREFLQRGGQ